MPFGLKPGPHYYSKFQAAMQLTPSDEQTAIINFIGNGHNVVGDCVAGSGKTTSVLLIAQAYPEKRILQVTYNKALKIEVRTKAVRLGINNLEVHTYNSLCVKYYNREGYNNDKLRQSVEKNAAPLSALPTVDLLVLDETQDMNPLFYGLVRKFMTDSPSPIGQMLVLGDKFQSIYGYIGADARFLTLCHEIWGRKFLPLSLSTSYRVTNQIAAFVNDAMVGHKRISAVRNGPAVQYIVCDTFKYARSIAQKLIGLITFGKLRADDIFVLAPSIKSQNTPMRAVENMLVSYKIPCFYPVSDEAQLDEDIIEGKVVFSTFHQSKGRERKFVIVFNFDNSYFRFYAPTADPSRCPEILYVATTRASETLMLVHNNRDEPLPFLQKSMSELMAAPYVAFEQHGPFRVAEPRVGPAIVRHTTSPTELTKHLKDTNISLLSAILEQVMTVEREAAYKVDVPSRIVFDGGNTEDVSDINGIAIPAIYEARIHGSSTIERFVRQEYDALMQGDQHAFLRKAYNKIGVEVKSNVGYIRLAILYVSFIEKIYNKISQITRHDWLTKDMVDECCAVLDSYLTADATFEENVEGETSAFPEFGCVTLKGRLDTLDDEKIMEIKCVDALGIEHKLQLLVYAWMWKNFYESGHGSREFKIVNIRTGEVWKLDGDSPLLDEALHILLSNKYSQQNMLGDAEFVKKCTSIVAGAVVPATCVKRVAVPLFVDDD
jgi:hypothetical protein